MRGNRDAEKSKDGTHHCFVVAEIMWHSSVGVDSEVVGVGEGFFLVRGESEHDGVGVAELVSGVEDWDMWFEGEIADDFLDALEGDSIWSGIVAGETGDGVHDVMSCVVAKVEEGTDEGAIGAFVGGFKGG